MMTILVRRNGPGQPSLVSRERRPTVAAQEERLAAIAAGGGPPLPPTPFHVVPRGGAAGEEGGAPRAAPPAAILRQTSYHVVRAGDVAAAVQLPGQTGRSAVWLYNEVHNRRVLVALAAAHAWREFAGQANWSLPGPVESVTAARSALVAALSTIVAFHRTEHQLMTQVGYGIGDISTAEKRQLAAGTGLAPPDWPGSPRGRGAAGAGRRRG